MISSSLVGYTGFVGSNIADSYSFDNLYNSKNITEAFDTNPNLLVYAGLRAEKFIANKFPEQDLTAVKEAFENIKQINSEIIVLISTIDIYKNPFGVDEDSAIDINNLQIYGYHRYLLEKWIEDEFENHLIIRLPGLFGKNLKKNFLYDYINIIPGQLTENKFRELSQNNPMIDSYYQKQDTGYYKCRDLIDAERKLLKEYFRNSGFTALNFTDSRSKYQYYNLSHLWDHIQVALKNNVQKLNITTEPICSSDLYRYLSGKEFMNEITISIPNYNVKTKYSNLFGGNNGYIYPSSIVMEEIRNFIKENVDEACDF